MGAYDRLTWARAAGELGATLARCEDADDVYVALDGAIRSLGVDGLWVGRGEGLEEMPSRTDWVEARVDEPVAVVIRARLPHAAGREMVDCFSVFAALGAATIGRLEERHRALSMAAKVQEADDFLREVIGPMPVGVVVRRGPAQRVTHSNRAAEELLGRLLQPGLGRTLTDVAASGLYRLSDEVIRTGQPISVRDMHAVIEPPGGEPREMWANVVIQPVHSPSGEVDGTAVFVVDTTEQMRQRRAIEAAEQRNAQLIESIHAIVWEAPGGDSAWSYVSEGAVQLLGYPRERWLQRGFWRTILHEEDRARVVATSGAITGHHEMEYRVFAADGRVVWLHDAVRVQTDSEGRPIRLRGVMLDITARKEAEAERARIQAEMVDLQKFESLGVMAGGIAHDFNNLLTVILGNASLAAMRLPEQSPAKSAIDDLIANAQRAADLTRQLLAYSGRAQLTSETLDLGVLLRELRSLMLAAFPKNATLDLDLDPLVPAVEGDPIQLQQVVMNLVTNAAESLGERSGQVSVQTSFANLEPDEAVALGIPPGAYVVLGIQDNGCGMNDATRRRVFDPFFTTKAHGRGLGLAAVHGIVRVHRGAVELRSREGVGTFVSVYLPATTTRAAPKPLRTAPLRSGSGIVLVIDDEAEVRSTARAMLEALGYDVIEAEDGRTGLLMYDRQRREVRVVLLDMTMPVMSGEEVYRELRFRDPQVRIVLSTGYSQVDARRRGLLEGVRGFLQKPYTVRQLADAMERALEPTPE